MKDFIAKPIVIIPSRMGASRLPNKPMASIAKEPMIAHVWRHTVQSNVGPVFVACDHPDIVQAIEKEGGQAVLTHGHHLTGSDRVQEAITKIDPDENYNIVINVQGDMPRFPSAIVYKLLEPFQDATIDMTTLIQHADHGHPKSVKDGSVKAHTQTVPDKPWHICTDFQRHAPTWSYNHLGFYAFRRPALKKFTDLDQTDREKAASLEQLRALDHGFVIAGMPVGPQDCEIVTVDTPEDLHRAQQSICG